MKTFRLYYYLIFSSISFMIFCMELDIDPKQRKVVTFKEVTKQEKIDQLKENPAQIEKILKEKKCWHSCFYTPIDIEIAEEAQRELADETREIRLLNSQNLNQEIVTFSPYKITLLKNSQLDYLSLETLNNLREDQLKAFTNDRLQILIKKFQDEFDYNNPADRKNIYTDNINIENILKFIDKLNNIPLSRETQDVIYFLKKTIYQNLTQEKLSSISKTLKNEDIVQAIKYHFNYTLDNKLKETLTNNFLNNPQEFKPEYIPYIHINEIEPFEMSILTPEHIKHLRLEQIKSLTNEQIEALTNNQMHAFSKGQLMNLPSNQVNYLMSSKKISLHQIQHIPPKVFSLIDPKIIENLSLEQLDALTDNQIQELSNSIKMSLLKKLTEIETNNKNFKNIIHKAIIRINNAITTLSKKHFNYYHKNIFNHLKDKIPTIRPSAQLHQMTIDDIKLLSEEKFRLLNSEEKHDIFEEIEKHYKSFNSEELSSIIDQYKPKEIKFFIHSLINTKSHLANKDAKSDNSQFSIKDIMNLDDKSIEIIKKSYPNTNFNIVFEELLEKYYNYMGIDQLKKDINSYKSNFIKSLLLKVMQKIIFYNKVSTTKKNKSQAVFSGPTESEMLDEKELLSFIQKANNNKSHRPSSHKEDNKSNSDTPFHTPQKNHYEQN